MSSIVSIPVIDEAKYKAFVRWELLRLSDYSIGGGTRNDATDMAALMTGTSTESKFKEAMFAVYNEQMTLHQAAAAVAGSGVVIDDCALKPLYLRDSTPELSGSGYRSISDAKEQISIAAVSLSAFEKSYLDMRSAYLSSSLITDDAYGSYLLSFCRLFGDHTYLEGKDAGFIKIADDLVQEYYLKSMLRSKGGIASLPANPIKGYQYTLTAAITQGTTVATKFIYKDAPTLTGQTFKSGSTMIYDPYYSSNNIVARWVYLETDQNIQPLTKILGKLTDFVNR